MTPGSDPLAAVAGWPVPTAAVGVTASDATLASTGPLDEPLPLASVTKLLTALAVLVAVEEETLRLDDPAGPEGSTVEHLLAHASGLGLDGARLSLPAAGGSTPTPGSSCSASSWPPGRACRSRPTSPRPSSSRCG